MTSAINPADKLAEQAVLGTAMIDPDCVDQVVQRCQPEHFTDKKHQQIFKAIADVHKAGGQPDFFNVPQRLMNEYGWKSEAYQLAGVADQVAAASMLDHYLSKLTEQHQLRQMQYLCGDLLRAASSRDLTEAIKLVDQLTQTATAGVTSPVITLSDAALEYAQTLEQLARGDVRRHRCGLPLFDHTINGAFGRGGILPGQVGVIAGRTGTGKSTLASFITSQMVANDPECRAHFFTLEMPPALLAGKAVARQIKQDDIKGKTLADRAKTAAYTIAGTYGDRITYSEDAEPGKVLARASQMARQGTGVFVFDHLHRIPIKDKDNARWVFGEFARDMSEHAKRHKVAWIMAAQLSRKAGQRFIKAGTVDQSWPTLQDISESAQIETHIHWCVALHFDDPRNRNQARLCLIKNRYGQTDTSEQVQANYDNQTYTRRF